MPKRPTKRNSRKRKIDRSQRMEVAFERVGSRVGKCAICGLSDARCLHKHHVRGQAYGDEIELLCFNHHAVRSDKQRDQPKRLTHPLHPLEKAARLVFGVAEQLTDHAEHAEVLAARLKGLGTGDEMARHAARMIDQAARLEEYGETVLRELAQTLKGKG